MGPSCRLAEAGRGRLPSRPRREGKTRGDFVGAPATDRCSVASSGTGNSPAGHSLRAGLATTPRRPRTRHHRPPLIAYFMLLGSGDRWNSVAIAFTSAFGG